MYEAIAVLTYIMTDDESKQELHVENDKIIGYSVKTHLTRQAATSSQSVYPHSHGFSAIASGHCSIS